MARIAFSTIGILKEPMGHPEVQGFMDRLETVFSAAESSSGFIDRSERNYETMQHSWGPVVLAPCFDHIEDRGRLPSTLTLWEDLESVAAYAYRGAHGEAMAKRREWFLPHDGPTYVAWWVEDGHTPSFEEAAERFQHLHDNGASAFAFDFRNPFDATGVPVQLNPTLVRAKVATQSD